jgi:hypothetical protein
MNGLPIILYENRFKDAVPVASSTAAGDYNVLNVRDWRNFTWWKPNAAPSTVTVDCGSAKNADYGFVYAEAGTYEIRRSTDNFGASNELAGTIVLAKTGLGLVTFASVARRYYRLTVPAGTPAVAIAAIGSKLEFPRRLLQPFDPLGHVARGQVNMSEEGNPLGAIDAFDEWQQEIQLRNIDRAWVLSTFRPAWLAHLKNEPFGFAWDPVDHVTELYHVAPMREYSAPSGPGNFVNFAAQLRGKVEW